MANLWLHSLTIVCTCRPAESFPGENASCPIHGFAGPRIARFLAATDGVSLDRLAAAISEGAASGESEDFIRWARTDWSPRQFATSIYLEERHKDRDERTQ